MTPSRNTHSSTRGDLYSTLISGGVVHSPNLIGSMLSTSFDDVRPASVNSPKSSSGWRMPTPWQHSSSLCRGSIGSVRVHQNGGANDFIYSGSFADKPPSILPPWPSYLEDTAVDKALLALSNQQVQLGENYAERREATEMISHRVGQVSDSVLNFKRKFPKDWATVKRLGENGARGIPNSWLETQYGWVPLLLDVKGVIDVMKHRDSDYDTFRVTVHGKTHDVVSQAVIAPSGAVNNFVHNTVTRFFCHVRLDYVMDTPAYHQLQELNLLDPVAIAWNLVPYSFVVDWFLPIGNYLQELTADAGYRFLGGSVSRYMVVDVRGDGQLTNSGGYSVISSDVNPAFGHNFAVDRFVLTSSPGPRVPHFKNPLSLHHFANAMSLLVNAFR